MSGGSARFIAMGGAGTALANDASSVEYNPAGFAYVKNINITGLTLGEVNKEVVGWNEDGTPKYEYRFNFTPLYAAFALSNLSVAYKNHLYHLLLLVGLMEDIGYSMLQIPIL
jgi:hypothetical protein